MRSLERRCATASSARLRCSIEAGGDAARGLLGAASGKCPNVWRSRALLWARWRRSGKTACPQFCRRRSYRECQACGRWRSWRGGRPRWRCARPRVWSPCRRGRGRCRPARKSRIASVTPLDSEISVAPSLCGSPVYKPSTSESRISRSAPICVSTSAESLSLSPKTRRRSPPGRADPVRRWKPCHSR